MGAKANHYAIEAWIDDANDSRGRRSDLHEAVCRVLKDAGITIAYPQLDLHFDRDVINSIAKQ